MSETPSDPLHMIDDYLDRGDALGWFEELYASADGDTRKVPWAHMAPRKEMVEWVFERQPDGKDKSALVIGCGLGDDAELLAGLNYVVTAFDISQTAIDWCKQRFPNSKVHYVVADMFAPPSAWVEAFDLVVEVYIVQALPPEMRHESVAAVAQFVAQGGTLLAVGRGMEECTNRGGPPWALFPAELTLFEAHGLTPVQFDRKDDAAIAPIFRYRAEYRRTDE